MENETKPARLVSVADAAERMSVSQDTVRRMINRGELTGYRLGKRLIRVDLDELEASIQPMNSTGRSPADARRDDHL